MLREFASGQGSGLACFLIISYGPAVVSVRRANRCKLAATSTYTRGSNEQEFARRSTGRADQFSLLGSRQSLDRRLQLARHRLIRADEFGEQPTGWIRARVSCPCAGKVLCVTRRHVKRDSGVDRVAAAQNQVHIPALRRPLSGRSRPGRWHRHGPILGPFTQDRRPRFRSECQLSGNGLNVRSWPLSGHSQDPLTAAGAQHMAVRGSRLMIVGAASRTAQPIEAASSTSAPGERWGRFYCRLRDGCRGANRRSQTV